VAHASGPNIAVKSNVYLRDPEEADARYDLPFIARIRGGESVGLLVQARTKTWPMAVDEYSFLSADQKKEFRSKFVVPVGAKPLGWIADKHGRLRWGPVKGLVLPKSVNTIHRPRGEVGGYWHYDGDGRILWGAPRPGKKVEQLLHRDGIVSASEVMRQPDLLPRHKGAYAWYFDPKDMPREIAGEHPLDINGRLLLYIGVAGASSKSRNTLRKRVLDAHLKGRLFSTLRVSLGYLLRDELDLTPRKKEGEIHFDRKGEQRLTEWLAANASVAWLPDERPWEIEAMTLAAYGIMLSLNIEGNPLNEFAQQLRQERMRWANEASES